MERAKMPTFAYLSFSMRLLKLIHTGYGLVVFGVAFILMFPLLMIPVAFPANFDWSVSLTVGGRNSDVRL